MVTNVAAVEIRDLRVEEAGMAAEFFHRHWRPNHVFYRNRDLLLWQYHDNPYARQFSDGMTFRGAFEGDRLIGTYGYMPFVFNRYGAREFGCYLSAYWVDTEHRRGPLPLRLLFSLQKQSSFAACVGGLNTPVAEQLYQSLGWVVVPNTPRLVCVLQEEAFASLLDSAAQLSLATRNAMRSAGPASSPKERWFEVVRLNSFAELRGLGWDEFYWKWLAPSHLGPARETSYLQWRYAAVPIFHYDAFLATRNGEPAGLLVYRVEQIRDSELRVIRLVDLAAEEDAIPWLVHALLQAARSERAVLVDFFATHPAYLGALRKCGFLDACDPGGARYWCPHLFQPLDHERMKLNCSWWIRGMDLASAGARCDFNLMKGDYEFDRPN